MVFDSNLNSEEVMAEFLISKINMIQFLKDLICSQKLIMGMDALKFFPNSGYLAKTHEKNETSHMF